MADLTTAQLNQIKKATGVDALCVFRTMDEKGLDAKRALEAHRKYIKKYEKEPLFNDKEKYLDEVTKQNRAEKLKLADTLMKFANNVVGLADEGASRDPIEYLMSIMQESNHNMPFASQNATDFGKALAREMDHKVYADLMDIFGGDEKAFKKYMNGDFDTQIYDVLTTIHEVDVEGKPVKDPITQLPVRRKLDPNNIVHRIAEVIQDAEDYRFNLLNENAANIEYRANRGMGQWLRADRLQSVTMNEVVEDFRGWLHPDMFKHDPAMTPEQQLKKDYKTIREIIDNYLDVEDGVNDEIGNRDYLAMYEGERKLRYKDSTSAIAAMEKYGSGSLYSNLSGSSYNTAKKVGLMSRFGANPDMGYRLIKNHIVKKYSGKIEALGDNLRKADNTYRYASGMTDKVGSNTNYDIATGLKATTRSTKFGMIGISALLDGMTSVWALRSFTRESGDNAFDAMWGNLEHSFNFLSKWAKLPFMSKEDKIAAAKRAGIVLETHNSRNLSRWAEEKSDPRSLNARIQRRVTKLTGNEKAGEFAGKSSNFLFGTIPDLIHKYSGIDWVTNNNRLAFADALSLELADFKPRSFDELPPGTQNAFKRAGLSADDWEVIRKLPIKESFGLNVETIDRAPLEYFKDKAQKKRLKRAFRLMYNDWSNSASPTGAAREDVAFLGNPDPTSIQHNAMRVISTGLKTAYKGGNVTKKVLSNSTGLDSKTELLTSGAFWSEFFGMTGPLIVNTYIVMQLRNIIAGREIDKMDDFESWFALVQRSGAFGIYGDVLLSQSNKFADDPTRSIVGPGFGTIDDVIKMGSSVISGDPKGKEIWKTIPGNNTWYAGIWLKRLMLEEAAGK